MKKQIAIMLAAALMVQPFAAYGETITAGSTRQSDISGPGAANWVQDEQGWWYRNSDGSYMTSEWRQIQGKWYYFAENGYMVTGLSQIEGAWYYFDEDGVMVTGQSMELNGMTYNFGDDGKADITSHYKLPTVIPSEAEKTDVMKMDDAMADQILSRIVNDSMTDRQKAEAIYSWVRGSLTYTVGGTVGDWPQAASEGLRRRRGNCYTFYATSLELLSRVGIPSIEVIRSKDNDHWWNLVYIDGAWYHFDTTPRRLGGTFCLLTTEQLLSYSRTHGDSHTFDQSLYPPTP